MDFMDTIHENPWEANYIETGHDELADEGNSKLDGFWVQMSAFVSWRE